MDLNQHWPSPDFGLPVWIWLVIGVGTIIVLINWRVGKAREKREQREEQQEPAE